jgi:hypothetical protein
VGLVQREIEAANFSTISLSMIPELTASAGVPRLAAVEHPFGLTLGLPGDAARQLAVLRGALGALVDISKPGETVHLPFDWDVNLKLSTEAPELPPIARYLVLHPWQLPKFLNRTPPALGHESAEGC